MVRDKTSMVAIQRSISGGGGLQAQASADEARVESEIAVETSAYSSTRQTLWRRGGGETR